MTHRTLEEYMQDAADRTSSGDPHIANQARKEMDFLTFLNDARGVGSGGATAVDDQAREQNAALLTRIEALEDGAGETGRRLDAIEGVGTVAKGLEKQAATEQSSGQ